MTRFVADASEILRSENVCIAIRPLNSSLEFVALILKLESVDKAPRRMIQMDQGDEADKHEFSITTRIAVCHHLDTKMKNL